MSRVQGCGVARSPRDPYEGIDPAKYTEIPRKRKHSHLSDCPVGCSYGPEQRPESNARNAQSDRPTASRRTKESQQGPRDSSSHPHYAKPLLGFGVLAWSHNPQKNPKPSKHRAPESPLSPPAVCGRRSDRPSRLGGSFESLNWGLVKGFSLSYHNRDL